MSAHRTIGATVTGAGVDAGVVVGYPSGRGVTRPLQLGSSPRLRSGTVLYEGSRIGDRLETGHHVVVREECELGDEVSIWSNTVIDYGCRLGDRVRIHANCYVAQFTEIHEDAFLAPGVTLANDLYPGASDSARTMTGPVIGAGAQLGVNVTVLPSVRLGAGCLVGAGSVVTRDVPAGAVVYGSPAAVHGRVDELTPMAARVLEAPDSLSGYRIVRRAAADGP
jgi:acetyltransferase-like isoleucine patch superfamily enzyme